VAGGKHTTAGGVGAIVTSAGTRGWPLTVGGNATTMEIIRKRTINFDLVDIVSHQNNAKIR
jgi:hypothetical protein